MNYKVDVREWKFVYYKLNVKNMLFFSQTNVKNGNFYQRNVNNKFFLLKKRQK